MLCILYMTPGGLRKGNSNAALINDILTASGHNWSQDTIDREIYKLTHRILPGVSMNIDSATEYINGLAHGGLTEQRAVELIGEKDAPFDTISSVIVEESTLPLYMWGTASSEERYNNFRDAAEWNGIACVCNMPKARIIHMARIRKVRDAELKSLDVPYLKALEIADTVEQGRIATKKQTLRDIPATFDLTTDTPEQLKAKWPSELPARE